MNKAVRFYALLAFLGGAAQAQTISSGTGVLIGMHTCTDAGCTISTSIPPRSATELETWM